MVQSPLTCAAFGKQAGLLYVLLSNDQVPTQSIGEFTGPSSISEPDDHNQRSVSGPSFEVLVGQRPSLEDFLLSMRYSTIRLPGCESDQMRKG